MADILIRGMEMPKNCKHCKFRKTELQEDPDWCLISEESLFELAENDCPLIELPPHGRLIDADELIAKQEEDAEIFMGSTNYGDKVRYDEAMNAVANIVNAPTVIPADKDGET